MAHNDAFILHSPLHEDWSSALFATVNPSIGAPVMTIYSEMIKEALRRSSKTPSPQSLWLDSYFTTPASSLEETTGTSKYLKLKVGS